MLTSKTHTPINTDTQPPMDHPVVENGGSPQPSSSLRDALSQVSSDWSIIDDDQNPSSPSTNTPSPVDQPTMPLPPSPQVKLHDQSMRLQEQQVPTPTPTPVRSQSAQHPVVSDHLHNHHYSNFIAQIDQSFTCSSKSNITTTTPTPPPNATIPSSNPDECFDDDWVAQLDRLITNNSSSLASTLTSSNPLSPLHTHHTITMMTMEHGMGDLSFQENHFDSHHVHNVTSATTPQQELFNINNGICDQEALWGSIEPKTTFTTTMINNIDNDDDHLITTTTQMSSTNDHKNALGLNELMMMCNDIDISTYFTNDLVSALNHDNDHYNHHLHHENNDYNQQPSQTTKSALSPSATSSHSPAWYFGFENLSEPDLTLVLEQQPRHQPMIEEKEEIWKEEKVSTSPPPFTVIHTDINNNNNNNKDNNSQDPLLSLLTSLNQGPPLVIELFSSPSHSEKSVCLDFTDQEDDPQGQFMGEFFVDKSTDSNSILGSVEDDDTDDEFSLFTLDHKMNNVEYRQSRIHHHLQQEQHVDNHHYHDHHHHTRPKAPDFSDQVSTILSHDQSFFSLGSTHNNNHHNHNNNNNIARSCCNLHDELYFSPPQRLHTLPHFLFNLLDQPIELETSLSTRLSTLEEDDDNNNHHDQKDYQENDKAQNDQTLPNDLVHFDDHKVNEDDIVMYCGEMWSPLNVPFSSSTNDNNDNNATTTTPTTTTTTSTKLSLTSSNSDWNPWDDEDFEWSPWETDDSLNNDDVDEEEDDEQEEDLDEFLFAIPTTHPLSQFSLSELDNIKRTEGNVETDNRDCSKALWTLNPLFAGFGETFPYRRRRSNLSNDNTTTTLYRDDDDDDDDDDAEEKGEDTYWAYIQHGDNNKNNTTPSCDTTNNRIDEFYLFWPELTPTQTSNNSDNNVNDKIISQQLRDLEAKEIAFEQYCFSKNKTIEQARENIQIDEDRLTNLFTHTLSLKLSLEQQLLQHSHPTNCNNNNNNCWENVKTDNLAITSQYPFITSINEDHHNNLHSENITIINENKVLMTANDLWNHICQIDQAHQFDKTSTPRLSLPSALLSKKSTTPPNIKQDNNINNSPCHLLDEEDENDDEDDDEDESELSLTLLAPLIFFISFCFNFIVKVFEFTTPRLVLFFKAMYFILHSIFTLLKTICYSPMATTRTKITTKTHCLNNHDCHCYCNNRRQQEKQFRAAFAFVVLILAILISTSPSSTISNTSPTQSQNQFLQEQQQPSLLNSLQQQPLQSHFNIKPITLSLPVLNSDNNVSDTNINSPIPTAALQLQQSNDTPIIQEPEIVTSTTTPATSTIPTASTTSTTPANEMDDNDESSDDINTISLTGELLFITIFISSIVLLLHIGYLEPFTSFFETIVDTIFFNDRQF